MIRFTKGNILQADVEALVNTVNTVGIMGKGIALAFKKAFPLNYKLYKEACDNKEFTVGSMFTTKTGQLMPKFIINFPTKEHWKRRSKIDFVKSGMKELVKTIKTNEIKSIPIPPLGCGNGGLNWNEVKPIIVNELQSINKNIEVIIYEPGFNNQTVFVKKEIALTPARAMLLCALKDYQILGYSINLLVAQKIAYFLQRIGEPLNLQYEKGHYGPYSNQLQHLLKYLNGYYLNFKHEETKPSSTISINHFDKVSNYAQKELDSNQLDRLKKTRELIEGFESPYGLELLATVDYVSQNENIINTEEMVAKIGEWTERKKEIMKPFHIDVAHKRLKEYYRQQWL